MGKEVGDPILGGSKCEPSPGEGDGTAERRGKGVEGRREDGLVDAGVDCD